CWTSSDPIAGSTAFFVTPARCTEHVSAHGTFGSALHSGYSSARVGFFFRLPRGAGQLTWHSTVGALPQFGHPSLIVSFFPVAFADVSPMAAERSLRGDRVEATPGHDAEGEREVVAELLEVAGERVVEPEQARRRQVDPRRIAAGAHRHRDAVGGKKRLDVDAKPLLDRMEHFLVLDGLQVAATPHRVGGLRAGQHERDAGIPQDEVVAVPEGPLWNRSQHILRCRRPIYTVADEARE